MVYCIDFQTVCRGTVVCHENFSGVPRNFFEIFKIARVF